MRESSRDRVVVAVIFTVVLVASAVAASVSGLNLWVPLCLAAVPWLLVLRDRFGFPAALSLVTIVLLWATLLGMVATASTGVPLVAAFPVLAIVVGVVGVTIAAATRAIRRRALSGWLPAATGPAVGALVWTGVVVVSRLAPGAGAYGWVMQNDSANNILFARGDIAIAGIRLGSGESPVPLPAGMLALGMAAGRSSVSSDRLLAHDLTSFVGVWAATVALLCVLVGAVVSAAISPERSRVRWLVGALASLLPLTWLVVGYPIEYGFFNAHVALVIVLASWLVFRRVETRPAIAVAALALACTVLLAVWSPLVLLPAALILVLLIRSPSLLWPRARFDRALVVAGTGQLLLFGALVTAPSLFAQASFLTANGAAYPFSHRMFAVLLLLGLILAFVSRRSLGSLAAWGMVAELIAFVIAYAVLVFAARSSASPLSSYYPQKLGWLAMVVVLVIGLEFVAGLVTRSVRSRVLTPLVLVGSTAAVALFAYLVPTPVAGYIRSNPLHRILAGSLYGPHDQVANTVLDFADSTSPTILWATHRSEETAIDFWVLEMQASSVGGSFGLRKAAYGLYDVNRVANLCHISGLAKAPLRVYSPDIDLVRKLAVTCPSADIRVVSDSLLP